MNPIRAWLFLSLLSNDTDFHFQLWVWPRPLHTLLAQKKNGRRKTFAFMMRALINFDDFIDILLALLRAELESAFLACFSASCGHNCPLTTFLYPFCTILLWAPWQVALWLASSAPSCICGFVHFCFGHCVSCAICYFNDFNGIFPKLSSIFDFSATPHIIVRVLLLLLLLLTSVLGLGEKVALHSNAAQRVDAKSNVKVFTRLSDNTQRHTHTSKSDKWPDNSNSNNTNNNKN